jgi:hypothetical protein
MEVPKPGQRGRQGLGRVDPELEQIAVLPRDLVRLQD